MPPLFDQSPGSLPKPSKGLGSKLVHPGRPSRARLELDIDSDALDVAPLALACASDTEV